MTWITDNWIAILLGGGFIAFHLFGHRGHGGHGSSHKHGSGAKSVPPSLDATPNLPDSVPPSPDRDAVAEEDSVTRPPKTGDHKH